MGTANALLRSAGDEPRLVCFIDQALATLYNPLGGNSLPLNYAYIPLLSGYNPHAFASSSKHPHHALWIDIFQFFGILEEE